VGRLKIDWGGGTVSAEWHASVDEADAMLLLTHGAGGDMDDPVLKTVGAALSDRGIAVLRFNLAYREAGRRAPGSQTQSEECWRGVADAVRVDGKPLFIGGKSYGGRMASHIVAAGYPVDGLVLLSYPLHPPGKTDRLRVEHLHDVKVRMLFVQGTKDSFATPSLLTQTVESLQTATHVPIEGGEHSLRVRGRPAVDVTNEISDAIASFVAS
jgi:predicted alpha/beta-hydrolase family hydrolase